MVTYKGKDFETLDFLHKISSPLGEIRYKVTLETFNRESATPQDCQKRIEKFKQYITEDIPQNWQRFFTEALASFTITDRVSTGTLIRIENEEAFKHLLETTKISNYLLRCERGHYYISQENIKAFEAELKRFGYMRPIRARDIQKREEKEKG